LTQTVDDWSGRSLEAVEQQLALKSATDGAADALSAQSGKVGGVAYAYDLFNQGVTKAITAQAKFAERRSQRGATPSRCCAGCGCGAGEGCGRAADAAGRGVHVRAGC
jgi:hypothetical protein